MLMVKDAYNFTASVHCWPKHVKPGVEPSSGFCTVRLSPIPNPAITFFPVSSPFATMDAVQAILANPSYNDYLSVLKGARNGLVYGAKVRFPHALIMAILFGRGEYVLIPRQIYYIVLIGDFSKLADPPAYNLPRHEDARLQSGEIRVYLQGTRAYPAAGECRQGTRARYLHGGSCGRIYRVWGAHCN